MVVAAVFGLSITAGAQEAYCTLGQHVWGHETREFNGVPIPALLDNLITGADPLVIGMPGRGVTFLDGSEPTITDGLPDSFEIVDVRAAGHPNDPPENGTRWDGAASEWGELSLRPASPVSDLAVISYSIPEPCRVRLCVYNIAGREVDVIMDGEINQRDNFIQVAIDSGRMPSGVYFVRMTATGTASGRAYSQTGKMLVVR